MNQKHIVKGMKFTIAALLAILLAQELGFRYAATAGIITILSIQNTKKDTLRVAGRRTFAFISAILISCLVFHALGYTVFAFGVYLFFFATLCFACKWVEAVAMDSVLIAHFLTEGNMHMDILCNEIALFVIGTGMGILANLHMHRKEADFQRQADMVDMEIKGVLKRMSVWLMTKDRESYNDLCFAGLEALLAGAKEKAYENWNNTIFTVSRAEIDYIEMREKQIQVLKHMYSSIKMLKTVPAQTEGVAQIIATVEKDYHKGNPVDGLLAALGEVFRAMESEPLPKTRVEFEDRAVLYYIMKQLEELLQYKRNFMLQYRELFKDEGTDREKGKKV